MVNVAVTVALLPALFTLGGAGAADGGSVLVAATATVIAEPTEDWLAVAESATTTTTTTIAPPRRPATTAVRPRTPATVARKAVTTAPPKRMVASVAPTPKPAPASVPAPSPAPKPATAEPAASGQEGKATYYTGGAPGRCAHRTLPFGTVVTVTAVASGKSVRCSVADRGPFVAGYVIDLDPAEFEQLAPRSAGVVNVRLTW